MANAAKSEHRRYVGFIEIKILSSHKLVLSRNQYLQIMAIFNVAYLLPEFARSRRWFDDNLEIVAATHFNNTTRNPAEYDNKVVIGRLLSITKPTDKTTALGRTVSAKWNLASNPQKKARIGVQHKTSSLILVFGDVYNRPNCFAIFAETKREFQVLFGSCPTSCEMIRVGDMVVIKNPTPCSDMLGESIVILRKPEILAGVIRQGWPKQPVITSTEGNWQIFFDDDNIEISVHNTRLLLSGQSVNTCGGYTCDRQASCQGCFGRAPTRKPIVLICSVFLKNVSGYKAHPLFTNMTSLRFTTMFFRNIETFSSLDSEVIESATVARNFKQTIENIVEYVNQHGAFRVSGWHRQGVRTEATNGDEFLSSNTAGHITLLEPTDPTIMNTDAFINLQFETPNAIELVPQIPAGQPQPQPPQPPPPPQPPAPGNQNHDEVNEEAQNQEQQHQQPHQQPPNEDFNPAEPRQAQPPEEEADEASNDDDQAPPGPSRRRRRN